MNGACISNKEGQETCNHSIAIVQHLALGIACTWSLLKWLLIPRMPSIIHPPIVQTRSDSIVAVK